MNNNVVNALIEIPLGSKNKYELDEKTGRIHLDRVYPNCIIAGCFAKNPYQC